jgi:hypothetical protein
VLGRPSDGQTADANGLMAHEGVPGVLQRVCEEHTSCPWRPTSESESLSLGELPRGETGAKDGLRETIRGCRLRRVFGVWGGHC